MKHLKDLVLNLLAGLFVIATVALCCYVGVTSLLEVPSVTGWAAVGRGVLGISLVSAALAATTSIGHDVRAGARGRS